MKFIDDSHTYINTNNQSYRSVTSLLKKLEKEKNWDEIAKKYAKKHNIPLEQVKTLWQKEKDDSIVRGKKYHSSAEAQDLSQEYAVVMSDTGERISLPVYKSVIVNGTKFESKQELPDGVYPELMLWIDEYQIAGQADKIIIHNKLIDVIDYKGLALDTPIATKHGWTTMENIKKGDIIFDGEGNLTEVEYVSDIHYNPCFKIKFDTNDEIICDHEHRWVVDIFKRKGKTKEIEMTTDEIFSYYLKKKLNKQVLPLKIKCTPINLPEINLPIDPYLLGMWLADGNRCDGTITNLNPLSWVELENRGYKLSNNYNTNNNKAESRRVYGLRKSLIELSLLKNKHIPDLYFRSSVKQRLDLLRGFFDGDGYFHKKRKRCVMNTTMKWQADSIMQLVSSLGYKPTIIPYTGSGFGKKNISMYTVVFTCPESPFLCRNFNYTEDMKNTNFTSSYFRNIKKIETVSQVPTKCISVTSNTCTYLSGYNLIKTHNTNKKIEKTGWVDFKTGKTHKLLHPCEHLDECNFSIYSLQMNFYAYIIKHHNPGYRIGKMIIKHIMFDDKGEPTGVKDYLVPNLQKEIKMILDGLKIKK